MTAGLFSRVLFSCVSRAAPRSALCPSHHLLKVRDLRKTEDVLEPYLTSVYRVRLSSLVVGCKARREANFALSSSSLSCCASSMFWKTLDRGRNPLQFKVTRFKQMFLFYSFASNHNKNNQTFLQSFQHTHTLSLSVSLSLSLGDVRSPLSLSRVSLSHTHTRARLSLVRVFSSLSIFL